MELEELKTAWTSVNRRLDDMQAFQLVLQRDIEQSHTRSAASQLKRAPIFELVVACITVLWAGGFLADNFSKIRLMPTAAIPVVLLDALGIFTIWLSVRQMIMISALDYSNPIVETQRQIAALKSLRVRSTQYMMLIGLPLWIIFPLVAGQAVFGLEFIRAVDKTWIVANLAFGVAASLAILGFARKFAGRFPFLQKVNDALAGTEITRAQELLTKVKDFERA